MNPYISADCRTPQKAASAVCSNERNAGSAVRTDAAHRDIRPLLFLRTIRRVLLAAAIAALILIAGAGCDDAKKIPDDDQNSATRTAEAEGVSLTLRVTPQELDYTDRANVVIEATAGPGMTVQIEDYAQALAEKGLAFELRVAESSSSSPDRPRASQRRWINTYAIEFVLPGEYEFPSATVTISKSAEDGGENGHEPTHLTTESIPVVARDPVGRLPSEEEQAKIQTLDPIELPAPWSRRWWWALPVVLGLLVLWMMRRRLAALWHKRKEALARRAVYVPPHVWARDQIDRLIAERFIENGRWQIFHYRISYILRGYIERRFRVSAGEMTTEEFLDSAASDGRFGAAETDHLRHFLTACDLVKYARHEPTIEDSRGVLKAAQSYIDSTCESDATAQPASEPIAGDRERAA